MGKCLWSWLLVLVLESRLITSLLQPLLRFSVIPSRLHSILLSPASIPFHSALLIFCGPTDKKWIFLL